jgi:hypothetical protein
MKHFNDNKKKNHAIASYMSRLCFIFYQLNSNSNAKNV